MVDIPIFVRSVRTLLTVNIRIFVRSVRTLLLAPARNVRHDYVDSSKDFVGGFGVQNRKPNSSLCFLFWSLTGSVHCLCLSFAGGRLLFFLLLAVAARTVTGQDRKLGNPIGAPIILPQWYAHVLKDLSLLHRQLATT
jgi:hypothetical protein